jgi:hypothetical protein
MLSVSICWIIWTTNERRVMKMHNPAHPGEMLAGWLEDLKTSVTSFQTTTGPSGPVVV